MPKRSDKDARIRRAAERAMEMIEAEINLVLCRDHSSCLTCLALISRRREIRHEMKEILREVGG